MDAIDRVVMNTRLHYFGSAARIVEPMHLAHRDKIRGFLYDLDANTLTEVKT
ncbi:MAG TPA: hypothetical protein VND96_06640 [Candidatus Micrarchaeaceae archaeon]|nr:hypothetical protein [Candidatus Micrarchaeaceae archaeon]